MMKKEMFHQETEGYEGEDAAAPPPPKKGTRVRVTIGKKSKSKPKEKPKPKRGPKKKTGDDKPVVDEEKPKRGPKKKTTENNTEIVESEIVESEIVDSEVIDSEVIDSDKKPRNPRLLAKYAKFIHFAYWFLNQHLNTDEETPAVDSNLFLEKIHLLSSVEDQTNFVQSFFDQQKTVNKDIRKLLTDKKKAAAGKKTRKPRANKKKDSNEFVQQLVSLANLQTESIVTSILHIDDHKYLIDEQLNVYDFINQHKIGTFNSVNQNIILN
jgi:hypothetical protein